MEITPVITSSSMMMEEDYGQKRNLYDQQQQQQHRRAAGGLVLDVDLCMDQLQMLLITEQSYLVAVAPRPPVIPCKYSSHHVDHRHVASISSMEEWRRKICQWSYRVVDNFRLDRSVVSMAMNLLDRYLLLIAAAACREQQQQEPVSSRLNSSMMFSPQGPQEDVDDVEDDHDDDDDDMSTTSSCCGCPSCSSSSRTHHVDSRTFQLASMTCLYIAIKVSAEGTEETEDEICRRKAFRLNTFCDLSRGLFTARDMILMEQDILTTLAWRVNPPASMTFVPYLLLLLPPTRHLPTLDSRATFPLVQHVLRELSRYLTELAVCLGSDLSTQYPPSQIAFCAILVSMNLLTQKALPLSVRKTFSQTAMRLFTSSRSSSSTTSCATAATTTMGADVQRLCSQLMDALWPEIILEDDAGCDPNHPISMAREYGLLDASQVCQYRVAQLAAANCFSDEHDEPQGNDPQASSCSSYHCGTGGGGGSSSPPGSPRGVDAAAAAAAAAAGGDLWLTGSPVSVVVVTSTASSSSINRTTSPPPPSTTTSSSA
jgi:Cyclin, N-terminal domain